jgi:hypothetical protein
MTARANAIGVIAKRKLFETVISPGYYITLSISLALGLLIVYFFADSVGSSGFNPGISPVYDLFSKGLAGLFGSTFVEKLFAEGPFFFALVIAFLPVLLYLSMSSAFKFGFEKNVGAIELIAYGPADGTAYFIASLVKDLVCIIVTLLVFLGFFAIAALIGNLVLGPMFFFTIVLCFFFAIAVFCYGILASVITDNEASSVALFLAIFVLFTFIQIGSFALVTGYVRNLSGTLSWILCWFSPVFYWHMALEAIDAGNFLFFFGNLGILICLSGVLIVASHFIFKARGVRA